MSRMPASGLSPRFRSNPRSCISTNAVMNIRIRIAARSTNGNPRLTAWARKPPAIEPVSMPMPVTIWPRASTDSSGPWNCVAASASTSHASTAPEKNVKPSPRPSETSAQAQNGASICQSIT